MEWFDNLKPLDELYMKTMERIVYLPQDFMGGKWKDVKVEGCCCDNSIVNIRWDGQINLCSWGFDDRLAMGDFLTTSLEELYEKRKTFPICKECIANKYTLYCGYTDMDEIDRVAHSRLPEDIALDRKFGG